MNIKLLPEGVWSCIAAGEVVERPSSAVKEMVENSLDAGASRVRVRLWDGGRMRIVVEDDGSGIAFDDLPLALTRHATSKIGALEDLEAIRTLGYRGEALASLAAVAKVEIRSRPSGEGGKSGLIRAVEGRVTDHAETNCAPGTRVQVDDLFASLPARRKFLKSAAGELRRVAALLREYAICRPEVAFAMEHDGKPVFSTDGGGERRRAIERLWGAEPKIMTVNAAVAHLRLECWWQPRQGRSEVSAFVNGRVVADPLIKGAVSAAGRELSGGWALFLTVDPALIDVNIHPAKAEIRFRYPGEVFDVVREAASLLGAPASVHIRGGETFSSNSARPPFWTQTTGENQHVGVAAGHSYQPSQPSRPFQRAPSASVSFQAPQSDSLFSRVSIPRIDPDAEENVFPDAGVFTGEPVYDADDGVVFLGQLKSGYLVFDTPGGLSLVDPHAAHERVAFERIRAIAGEGRRSQTLLMPLPLPPTLRLEAEERKELLEEAGFALQTVEGELRLSAVPVAAATSEISPEALLRASLAALRDETGADPVELLWRVWATMACKEAVKVTTKLNPEEAVGLWRALHECRQPFFCPHGRPTVLEISVGVLEKHFGRE